MKWSWALIMYVKCVLWGGIYSVRQIGVGRGEELINCSIKIWGLQGRRFRAVQDFSLVEGHWMDYL